MYDSDPMTAISAMVPTEPLSPARAALADSIERLAAASARMEEAQRALVGLERPPASMSSRDAGELRADMTRLHEITNWLGARAGGDRPPLSAELKEAEAWLGEVAGTIGEAEERLSAAERNYADAAHAARDAHIARERAVWAASVDAAGPAHPSE